MGGGGLQSAIRVEGREELIEDNLCDVLCLRTHSHSLGTDVHGENLRGPDPSGCSPRWLVEENEKEEHEYDGNSDWFCLSTSWRVGGFQSDERDDEHAHLGRFLC